MSVKDIRKAERDQKKVITNAKKMIKDLEDLPVYVNKKKEMTMKQRMGIMDTASVTGINVPKPFNFKEIKDKYQLKAKLKGIEYQVKDDYYDKKMQVFKENFIDKLNFTFGFMGDELDEFLDKLRDMDTMEFYQMFQMYPDSFDFSLYGSEGDEGYDGLTEDFFYRIQSDYEHYMETEYGGDLKHYNRKE